MGIFSSNNNFYFQSYCFDTYSYYFTNHSLFFRPKLRIEHATNREHDTFYPEHTFGHFDQRYLRIRVRNKGYRILHNCQASLRVIIPNDDDFMRYPSDDSKLLSWGRSPDKSDLTTSRNIQAHSNELLFVVFSDSDFPNQLVDAPIRYASIAILERLTNNIVKVEDTFTNGEFVVEIIITSDEGPYTKAKFRVTIGTHWRDLTMKKLSISERLKLD